MTDRDYTATPASGALRDRMGNPDAVLSRTDLRDLGFGRRAVDAVFRALPIVVFPGCKRAYVRVGDYRQLEEHSTYRDDRVRPCGR